jgi:hypothetical protein
MKEIEGHSARAKTFDLATHRLRCGNLAAAYNLATVFRLQILDCGLKNHFSAYLCVMLLWFSQSRKAKSAIRNPQLEDPVFVYAVLVQPQARCRAAAYERADYCALLAFDDAAGQRARACACADDGRRACRAVHPAVAVLKVDYAGAVKKINAVIAGPDAVLASLDNPAIALLSLSLQGQCKHKEREHQQEAG